MFPREFDLLRDCCRWSFAGGPLPGSAEPLDWSTVLRLARRHRVQALAWDCLSQVQLPMPAEVASGFAGDAARIVAQNLASASECRSLFGAFERAGVSILFIKGVTLGALAYPKPFLKMSWDIDVLVSPDRLEQAAAILRECDWQVRVPPASGGPQVLNAWHARRKESVWAKAGEECFLELHTRLQDNPRLIPRIGMGSDVQRVEVVPGLLLPTLCDDALFAYLCVHGASSNWFRLKWITDVAALLHRQGAEQIGRLWRRSQELGAGRSAAQALLLSHQLYGTELAPELLDGLGSDRVARRLAQSALRELGAEREPTERPFGTVGIHLAQFALLPGWEFKRSEFVRQIGDAFSG